MAVVRLQSRAEVAARIAELRPLTMPDDSSDMNRLLDEVASGTDQLLVSTVAEEDGRIVGWASAELFQKQVVAGVFVHTDNRCQGIGSKLVELLLSELARVRPGVHPRTGPEPFWRRFLVNPVKLPVYRVRMGKLLNDLRTILRDREEPRLWTDADLDACLQRAARDVAAITGEANATAADLASSHPTSRSIIVKGGMVNALWMLVEEATQVEGGWVFRGVTIPDDGEPPTLRHAYTYEHALEIAMMQYEQSLSKLDEVFGIIRAAKAS